MITKREIHRLANLLVKYYKSINNEECSVYGEKMDKALCKDLLQTLYRVGDYDVINECFVEISKKAA